MENREQRRATERDRRRREARLMAKIFPRDPNPRSVGFRPEMNKHAGAREERFEAVRHNVSCIEDTECPGVIEVTCSCGRQSWTPWGRAHAEEIAQIHIYEMRGATAQSRTFVLS